MPSAATSSPLLTVSGLALERGGRCLFSQLDFEVSGGQLIQLAGVNGAGKTSLMRILAGLSRYGFDGRVVQHCPILYLGHQPGVKALLTPRENLAWDVSGQGQYSTAEIDQALQQVGLYGYEESPCHSLSAGQHRRVNLARLYLSDRPLWLLDEPFTAIDKAGVAALESQILSHVQAGGAAVITSHQPLQIDYPLEQLTLGSGAAA